MAPTQEIIPPSRSQAPARRENSVITVSPSRVDLGGVFSSTLMRWEADRHTRTLTSLAACTRAQGDLSDAQSVATESYIKLQRALGRFQELPEIIATDRARRRIERAGELREVQHQHEIVEVRRLTEMTYVERELLDARQALKAQRDHGYSSYELDWKKRCCEMLNVDLSTAESRAILSQHLAELDQPDVNRTGVRADASDAAIDDALYEARAQLLANGLDVSRIDALIQRRRAKR